MFQLTPWGELGPKIHKANCDAALDKGCAAYGVEWAKTIGLPVGQTRTTYEAFSTPDAIGFDQSTWKPVSTTGTGTAKLVYRTPLTPPATSWPMSGYLPERHGGNRKRDAPVTSSRRRP